MKKFIALCVALILILALAACGSRNSGYNYKADADKIVVLKVGASPTPHAEILREIAPLLAAQNIKLEVIEYGDYTIPNTAVESHELAANFFQHKPYLDEFNAKNSTHLSSVIAVHYEPFGIYPGRVATLDALPDGALIGVPSDPTNEARALQLLQAQGLIVIKAGVGLSATPKDIVENPYNLKFQEIEAAMLPRITQDVDFAVINGNYALQAGFSSVSDALAVEDASSEAAQTFGNILAVYAGDEQQPAIQALAEALTSQEAKDFISRTYNEDVVPLF